MHVVRRFDDKNITHVSDKVDPLADIDIINNQLALADLDTVSKRKDKAEKRLNPLIKNMPTKLQCWQSFMML